MRGPVLVPFVICTASHSALAAVEPSYRGADEVLKALGATAFTGAEPDLAAELETFRKTGHTGPPRVVAERFTDLVTRVLAQPRRRSTSFSRCPRHARRSNDAPRGSRPMPSPRACATAMRRIARRRPDSCSCRT